MKKILLAVTLIFLNAITTFAQTNLDSLWVVWNDTSLHDTIRLNAINKLEWDGYLFSQPDSAFYFAQLEYDFAKRKGLKKQMANARNTQGVSFYYRGNYIKALDYYQEALEIREEIGNKQGIATSLNNIGMIYASQGDYVNAIVYYTHGLKIREEIGNKPGVGASLNNIGLIYADQGNFIKATNYYMKSIKIKEELGDKKGISASLINLGLIYAEQDNYFKAIEYYSQSLKIYEEIGDKHGIATAHNNLGLIYAEQGDYAKINSLECDALLMKAIEHYTLSSKIFEEIGNKKGIAGSLKNIGTIYFIQDKLQKAIFYCQRALLIAQEVGAIVEIRSAAEALFKSYKATKQYQKALEMYELYISSRDSILSEESQRAVIQQEFKYNYEKQAAVDSIKAAETKKVADAQITAQQAQIKQGKTQQYALFGGLFLVVVFAGFMYNRFRVTRKQKGIIEQQKELVEEKQQEILSSITYAKRIQKAILPPDRIIKEYLPESFILYTPKDIVAGDFYWMEVSTSLDLTKPEGHPERSRRVILLAAADCTGHGVPGAMVSVICNNGLNRSVREYGITEPGKILDKTREIVIQEFEKSDEEVKDGMDIALCSINLSGLASLQYAGANNPLWIIRKNNDGVTELVEVKPDKQPIGKYADAKPFTTHTIELQKGDTIYIFTDGFADQFGGPKGKKYMYKPFKELLLSIQEKVMEEQKEIINTQFNNWKGTIEQVDDLCIIGVRI